MIRHLGSRRAQRPERASTPKTTSQRTGMLNSPLPLEKSLEVKLQEEMSSYTTLTPWHSCLDYIGDVEDDLLLASPHTECFWFHLFCLFIFMRQNVIPAIIHGHGFPVTFSHRLASSV